MAHVRERPPLRTSIEVETPSGKRYRWAENEPQPENVPSGVRWSDTMPGGFESMDCVLPRKSGVDYSDLEQLSTLRVRGASGDIAGEYRLERSPRTSGEQMAISPGAVGWQAHLEDNKSAREVYVDRDFSKWEGQSVQRRIDSAAAGIGPLDGAVTTDASTGFPAFATSIQGDWAASALPRVEGKYDAGAGVKLDSLYYAWKYNANINPAVTNWQWQTYLAASDTFVGAVASGNLRSVGPGTGLLSATGSNARFAVVQLFFDASSSGGENKEFALFWTCLAVYGQHGLTRRGTNSATEAWGFYASDVVAHAVGQWAPRLVVTSDSVQPSGFIIPHLTFLEPTTAGEIVRQATRFGLQDWAVWDGPTGPTFYWHERGTFSKRWRARVAPAQLDETGPQVDRLWESIIVSYQDVDGSTRTVGPIGSGANVEDASLKDDDPDNPANQLGIVRRDVLQMGTSTSAGAIEVGRRFLEASKELDRSGRAQLVGHVEDDHGVVHPYWRPRAGDYIQFVDASDPSYRRIVRTDKDHSTRTCSLDLDAPPEGLQALLERLGVVLVPLGIS